MDKEKLKISINSKVIKIIALIIIILSILILIIIPSIRASNLAFLSYRFYTVSTRFEDDIAIKGDLLIVKEIELEDLKIGDKIVYKSSEDYYADKIVDMKQIDENNTIITIENNKIKYKFNMKDIKGIIVNRIPDLGSIIIFLKTILGFVFFSIFTFCIYMLLRIILLYDVNYFK